MKVNSSFFWSFCLCWAAALPFAAVLTTVAESTAHELPNQIADPPRRADRPVRTEGVWNMPGNKGDDMLVMAATPEEHIVSITLPDGSRLRTQDVVRTKDGGLSQVRFMMPRTGTVKVLVYGQKPHMFNLTLLEDVLVRQIPD